MCAHFLLEYLWAFALNKLKSDCMLCFVFFTRCLEMKKNLPSNEFKYFRLHKLNIRTVEMFCFDCKFCCINWLWKYRNLLTVRPFSNKTVYDFFSVNECLILWLPKKWFLLSSLEWLFLFSISSYNIFFPYEETWFSFPVCRKLVLKAVVWA